MGDGGGGWGRERWREAMSCDSFVVRRFRSCLGGREEEKGGGGTDGYSVLFILLIQLPCQTR